MSEYRDVFPNKHTFLVVVHVENKAQALKNVKIAQREGADGVFLINHTITDRELLHCYQAVVDKFPDYWTGVNCLVQGIGAISYVPETCAGLWVDNAGIEENASGVSITRANFYKGIRTRKKWPGLYFGGVAFKGQKPVQNLYEVTKAAIPFMDAITTSGDDTGVAPYVEKIRVMKEAAGTHPLVIASGITPENVRLFMPHADGFLVASGISYSHTELNPSKLAMVSKILGK